MAKHDRKILLLPTTSNESTDRLPPLRQLASLFPLPTVAHSCPRSCTLWGCSLFASRHPSSRCPTWPPAACDRARAGAAPCSHAGVPVPLASPRDGYLLPAAMHSPGRSFFASRHPSSHCPTWRPAACDRARAGAGPSSPAAISSLTVRWTILARGLALAGLFPLRQPASLFPYAEMDNYAPSLALLPHRKPASVSPLPRVATSCPRSRTHWCCSLFASRHLSSLSQIWPI